MSKPASKKQPVPALSGNYSGLVGDIGKLLEAARRSSARAVNAFMTATYWDIGRRIVEFEQGGEKRAGYGEEVLRRLAHDLTAKFGRGFSRRTLQDMRSFYLAFRPEQIWQTLSAKSGDAAIRQTLSAQSSSTDDLPAISEKQPRTISKLPLSLQDLSHAFPLPWSHYVLLITRCRSRYATDALPNKLLVREYLTALPDEKLLSVELEKTRKQLEARI